MTHSFSNRVQDSAGINLLSAAPSSKSAPAPDDGFSRALEQRVRTLDRSPGTRPEERPQPDANRSEARRSADVPGNARHNRTDSRQTGQPEAGGKTADTESSDAPAAATAMPSIERPTTIDAESVAAPANLAVLASIIAALDKTAGAGVAPTDEGRDDLLDGQQRRRPGFNLASLLSKTSADADKKDIATAVVSAAKSAKPDVTGTSAASPRVAAAIITPTAGLSGPSSALHALSAETPTGSNMAPAVFAVGLRTEHSGVPQLQIHTPAGQRAWAEDIGSRLTWMIGRGESRAELVLTPPSLGKLGVTIQTNGDQTTAHFVTSSAAAREALEQALPRLREALQQAGINLGQTDVSTSGDQQSPGEGSKPMSRVNVLGREGEAALSGDMAGISMRDGLIRAGTGVIDTFA